MSPPPILEALQQGPLVFDGAVGTQLYERGIFVNRSFDEAVLSRPDLVRQVHQDYLEAGANIITTNTFSSNRIKLKKYNLDEKLEEIVTRATQIAREVAGDDAWVAGSIGPTGLTPTVLTDSELEEIKDAFSEQARLLAESGADLIVLETFRHLSEIRLAIQAVHQVCDLPVFAHMAFDTEGLTADGATPERVVMLLKDWGADVVGANCMEGPHFIFDVVKQMVGNGVPISAQPNAGYPRRVNERLVYMTTPEYFATYARRFFKNGCAIVGGCCGTGPEHIAAIASAATMMGGGRSKAAATTSGNYLAINTIAPAEGGWEPAPVEQRSGLAEKIFKVYRERVKAPENERAPLTREHFVVSVEVNPPRGLDFSKAIKSARNLIKNGVDVINIADGPRASVRMANSAFGTILQRELGVETILHVCGRDRNLLGLQSDILAAHALQHHNLVIITGDPPKVGDYPHATAVFDLDSIGILRMVTALNHGYDPAGKPIGGGGTSFVCACGAEPAAFDYDRELRRLEQKKASGAHFVMTQPVYDPVILDRFLDDIAHLDMPVLVGLLPLANYRNAEFLHNEVPGMAVPEDIRARMREASEVSKDAARAEGVKIAQEALAAVADRVVGAYIMPPLGRYSAALEVLSAIEGYSLSE